MFVEWLEPVYNLYGGYGYYFFQTGVPDWFVWGVQFVMLLSLLVWYAIDKGLLRKCIVLLLIDYILIIFGSTVLFREEGSATGLKLIPLWSYKAIFEGNEQLVLENILNVLVFIPIGVLTGILIGKYNVVKVLFLCLSVSVAIEIGQLVFNKGYAEVDDIIHNSFGGIIGYYLINALLWLSNKIVSHSRQVSFE